MNSSHRLCLVIWDAGQMESDKLMLWVLYLRSVRETNAPSSKSKLESLFSKPASIPLIDDAASNSCLCFSGHLQLKKVIRL